MIMTTQQRETTMAKTITITNSFHGTEYRTRRSHESLVDLVRYGIATDADRRFARRAKRALCGSDDCTCSDDIGARPSLYAQVAE
jgi:hypothetical protein